MAWCSSLQRHKTKSAGVQRRHLEAIQSFSMHSAPRFLFIPLRGFRKVVLSKKNLQTICKRDSSGSLVTSVGPISNAATITNIKIIPSLFGLCGHQAIQPARALTNCECLSPEKHPNLCSALSGVLVLSADPIASD